MAIWQDVITSLKNKYNTVEELKAAPGFATLTPKLQEQAVALYTPVVPKTRTTETNIDPMALEPWFNDVKTQVVPQPKITTTTQETKTEPTTTKPTEPSKTDTSSQRLAEIQTNLTNYATTQPELFTDVNTYKSFFWYNQRAPEQKAVLDSFFTTQQVKNEEIKKIQDRYATLNIMSDNDLMNITDTNDINIINQDPILQAKYQVAQKNKQMLEFVYGKDYNKPVVPEIDGLDNIAWNLGSEITAAAVEYQKVRWEMDKLQDTIDWTYESLVKQYAGTWETDSYIRAKANKINSELTNQYNDKVREANMKLATYSALQAESQANLEEEQTKKQDRVARLWLYESMYGNYSYRNRAQEWVEIQTKDFGTTKSPDRRQSLDGGKTRQKIDWLWGWGGWVLGGSGWSGWVWWTSKSWAKSEWMAFSLDEINNAPRNLRLLASSWKAAWIADARIASIQNNYDYIKNNLMLRDFVDLKSKWATFGAMSEAERTAIKSAATRLNYNMSDADWNKEIATIRKNYNLASARAWWNQYVWWTQFNPTISRVAQKYDIPAQDIPVPTTPTNKSDTKKRYSSVWETAKKIFRPWK